MEKLIKPIRIFLIFAVMSCLLIIYVVSLYDLQINQGDEFRAISQNNIVTRTAVEGSRGSIYDRNGKLLVGNTVINNITINWSVLSGSDNPNNVLLRLVRAAQERQVEYTDSLPVTADSPFKYENLTSTKSEYLDAYKEYYSLDENISAVELMAHLRTTYNVDPTYSAEDARCIVGIRYELDMRYAKKNLQSYIFAQDVDIDFIALIGEQQFPGIEVTESSGRAYYTTHASHILGTIGLLTSEDVATYVEQLGYPNDAYVGKSGVENYFESFLHGTNGTELTTTNSDGAVIGVSTETEAQPGDNVFLSIDIDLQAAAEISLQNKMTAINSTRKSNQKKATGAAAVVMSVDTGEVLTMASLPDYNIATFAQDYQNLAEDETKPLLNRATSETYAPGSTFKMVTAMAAMNEGYATPYTNVQCTGLFTLGGQTWRCMSTHGSQDIRSSITNSCNYYYYTMATYLNNSELIGKYAAMFGLGEPTGIELNEALGTMDTASYRQALYDANPDTFFGDVSSDGKVVWYQGQTLNIAIGQGDSKFTPLQMASYVSTVANRGVRYSASLLNRIESYDGSETVKVHETQVASTMDNIPADYWDAIIQGMKGVTETGTGKSSVLHGYSVDLASKTGTAQTSSTDDSDTSLFVCYAPYDNPEIAIAVIIENGGSGGNSIQVAKDILDSYFSEDVEIGIITGENTLIG